MRAAIKKPEKANYSPSYHCVATNQQKICIKKDQHVYNKYKLPTGANN